MQATEERVALKLNEDYCSSCSICSSLCPFEAIKRDEAGKVFLEIGKCQVCGICYSACPANAIDISYYDIDSLIKYVERAKQEYDTETLVIMCKGSAPDFAGIERLFGVSKFIPLLVPCVGRIPTEVFPKVLTMGIEKIYILACDEDYCRFEKGSSITRRRISVLNLLLEQLGYGKELITLKQNSLKVKANRELCIRCGNCVFYCPYDAVKLESSETAKFDLDLCRGCGLCVAVCPAMALELENWEGERISTLLSKLSSEMESPKILVFRCQWAVFSPLDGEFSQNVRIIDLPCAGRVDTFHILEAFQKGIDGVLVVACPEEECKLERGSQEAHRLVTTLKERLSQIGFGERLHFCSVAPRYPETFERELQQFRESIEAILKEAK
jgi:coenzyme F420-reducing hydrogenase delta subunit